MGFDSDIDTATASDDAQALKQRREALRAFAHDIARIAASLTLPETYLDAERCARALTVCDRAIQGLDAVALEGDPKNDPENDPQHASEDAPAPALNSETKRLRLTLRAYADRLMEAVTFIKKPDNFIEVERAERYALAADRLLTQLYVAPKAASRLAAPTGTDSGSGFTSTRRASRRFADDLEAESPHSFDRMLPGWAEPVTGDEWHALLYAKLTLYRPETEDRSPKPPDWYATREHRDAWRAAEALKATLNNTQSPNGPPEDDPPESDPKFDEE